MTHPQDEPPTRALSALELQACLEAQREPEVLTSAITRVAIQRSQHADLRGFVEHAEAHLTRTSITVLAASGGDQETRLALPRHTRRKPLSVREAPTVPRRFGARLLAFALPLLAVALTGFFTLRTQAPSRLPARASAHVTPSLALSAGTHALAASQAPRTPPDHTPASPRRAVDLLLSGRTRDALDAYRALALEHPAEPSYALIVELLQRDLKACASEGQGACP